MNKIKGKQGRLVVFLCSAIIIFEIIIIVYYYNFLEKQLFNERKALFSQFVEKVSENVDCEIETLWNNTDTYERLMNTKQIDDSENLVDVLNEIRYITAMDDAILMVFNEDGNYYTSDEHEGRISDASFGTYAKNKDKHKLYILNLPYRKKCETYFLLVNRLDKKINIEKNEEITHIAMAVNVDSLKELFTTEGYEDDCYTFLSNNQGRILYKNTYNHEFLDGYNIISSITTSAKVLGEDTLKDIEKSFKNGKKTAYEIEYNNDKWFVANNVIEAVECNLIVFAPSKLISVDTAMISDGTTYFFIVLLGLNIMLFYTIFAFVRISIKKDRMMIAQQKKVNELLEKQAYVAESASKAKSQFLSYMSHDIRTPMNGIMGMTDIAMKNIDKKDKVNACLQKISDSSKHLLSLLNDILDLSRIESGKVSIDKNPMNIMSLVENCATIMEGQIITRQLEFVRDFDEISYPHVLGDELHLRQILINILGNAIKFTKDGGKVTFSVKEEVVNEEKVDYLFTIEDTGIGMSEEFLEHIWDAFSQEEKRANIKCIGTGLGMAITKQFVDMMGGQIEVSSKLHKGSKFTVKLSFELDKNEQGLEVTDIEDVDINGMRILLVEDNELNREIAMEVLKEEGAYVDVAVDGKEALDIFTMSKQGAYEAIIMDVMMPNMDGITATRHIRSSEHKDAISIPIIAMTANAFEEDIKKTKEVGMNAHISKPLNPTVLFSELMRIKREKSREECIV